VYRLSLLLLDNDDELLVYALFEQVEGRKTQKLIQQGFPTHVPGPVRKLSHAEAYDVLSQFTQRIHNALSARLDDKKLF